MTTNQQRYASDQARWTAIVERDRSAQGSFWYGVRTTGVYCRPGCASRQPSRRNVRFFDSSTAAEQAGFRPCKRCQPAAQYTGQQTAILAACARIEAADEPIALDDLAASAGLSPFHFHRLFKAHTGVTPRQYALAQRRARLAERLRQDTTVGEAALNSGFASIKAIYEQQHEVLGMTPTHYRSGARGLRIRYASAPCSLGWVVVAATDRGVCAIQLGDSAVEVERTIHERFPNADLQADDGALDAWLADAVALIETPERGSSFPLDVQGTAFQQRVWAALREIPPGQTATYSQIAERIGHPGAARAVGQACAINAVAVAIPCHRALGSRGDLTGYRWGTQRKQELLRRERDDRSG